VLADLLELEPSALQFRAFEAAVRQLQFRANLRHDCAAFAHAVPHAGSRNELETLRYRRAAREAAGADAPPAQPRERLWA
jgi:hypothetical protein